MSTSALAITDDLFFNRAGLNLPTVETVVSDALAGADDGELFLEYAQSESLSWDDGRLKNASFDINQGFGLRSTAGEASGYAHASSLSDAALRRAAETVRAVHRGYGGTVALPLQAVTRRFYIGDNPLSLTPFDAKIKLLSEIDAYVRARDPRIAQVSISLTGSWQAVQIIRPDGKRVADLRPQVRLNVSVVVAQGDRMEHGSHGGGGRVLYDLYLQPETWRAFADEALRQALVNLDSVPAPAGEMTVVLGPGWPGVMLHEAVGHGLEGDFNRKKISAFSNLLGTQVAARGVTVVDDGTLEHRRGSLSVDDEGTPTQCTTLIENGVLVGYMQDRMNARLMNMAPTGNGRRQGYAHPPLPRMTNTIMRSGNYAQEDIIASVKNGLYAVNFGGGQVDITSGKFVFSASEAYLIENGRIGPAVKGASLVGNGPDVLTRVSMIGNDCALDPGVGVCGKDGQGVAVGVGQPTLRIDGVTVGGTAT
ncbi:metalloprotease subunit TldD [Azospirillaceae bacterium]